jgi:hypothetical protein
MKHEYHSIPSIPQKCRRSMPKPYRHTVTTIIDIDERDGCMINGKAMSFDEAVSGLRAIAEGRYHV